MINTEPKTFIALYVIYVVIRPSNLRAYITNAYELRRAKMSVTSNLNGERRSVVDILNDLMDGLSFENLRENDEEAVVLRKSLVKYLAKSKEKAEKLTSRLRQGTSSDDDSDGSVSKQVAKLYFCGTHAQHLPNSIKPEERSGRLLQYGRATWDNSRKFELDRTWGISDNWEDLKVDKKCSARKKDGADCGNSGKYTVGVPESQLPR